MREYFKLNRYCYGVIVAILYYNIIRCMVLYYHHKSYSPIAINTSRYYYIKYSQIGAQQRDIPSNIHWFSRRVLVRSYNTLI